MKLNRGVWNSSSVSRKTKIRLCKTVVKPVLVYGCETWKMNEGDAKKPDNDCVTALVWAPEEERKRDRPKTIWRCTVEKMRARAWWQSWREVRTTAQDRNRWRAYVKALSATLAPGNR